jgi:hypothetical protein
MNIAAITGPMTNPLRPKVAIPPNVEIAQHSPQSMAGDNYDAEAKSHWRTPHNDPQRKTPLQETTISTGISNPAQKQQDDEDDQDDTDDTDTTVTEAIAVAAEAATEATKQEDDEDNDEYKSERHDLTPWWDLNGHWVSS